MFKATPDQAEFIKLNAKGKTTAELTNLFNKKFNTDIKTTQIRAFKQRNKITSGVDTRFKKGSIPFNKGKKGVGGWEPTQFKKGNIPANHRKVGSERIDRDGYVLVKVAEPNKWKLKHRVVWEEANGPIPEGYHVIFSDGNKENLSIDNLILVSRKQLLTLNKNKLIKKDADLTKTGLAIANVLIKISELKNEGK